MSAPVRISLPWPSRKLHPNSRPHWRERAKAAKAARQCAHWTAIEAKLPPITGTVKLTAIFTPPTNRAHDLDGLMASCKSYFDGISDAIGIDDRKFRHGEPTKLPHQAPGSVTIQIEVIG